MTVALTQRLRDAPGEGIEGDRQLSQVSGNRLELRAEDGLTMVGLPAGLAGDRGGFALLGREAKQFAGLGDGLLNEVIEPFVERAALLQVAHLLGQIFTIGGFKLARRDRAHGGVSGRSSGKRRTGHTVLWRSLTKRAFSCR